MKKYRFFYHYNKKTGRMSVHFKKVCYSVDEIICDVPCNTKHNKTQPHTVMQGFAKNVMIGLGQAKSKYTTICQIY